jgi:hypothetical protein
MRKRNEKALHTEKRRAMKLDELRALDPIEMQACIRDVRAAYNCDEKTARIVSAAWRDQALPAVALDEGLTPDDIASFKDSNGKPFKTTSPANEITDEEIPVDEEVNEFADEEDDVDFEDDEDLEPAEDDLSVEDAPIDDMGDGITPNDESSLDEEEDDWDNDFDSDDMSGKDEIDLTLNHVPKEKLDALQRAIDEILGGDGDENIRFGDEDFGSEDEEDLDLDFDDSDDDFSDEDDDFDFDSEEDLDGTDEFSDDDDDFRDDDEPEFGRSASAGYRSTNRGRLDMTKKALAQRSKARKQILAAYEGRKATAQQDIKPRNKHLGVDTSWNGEPYRFDNQAQFDPQDSYKTMTLEGSEGNSLRADNPRWNKTRVPTTNPDLLGLGDSYEAFAFDGSAQGDLDYSVEFDFLNDVPSGSAGRDDNAAVPTQEPEYARRKRTVASLLEDEEFDLGEPIGEGDYNPTGNGMDDSELKNLLEDLEDENPEDPEGEGFYDEAETEMTFKVSAAKKKFTREAELYKARIKTAYSVASQLAVAGLIPSEDVDGQVQWFVSDGMSPEGMRHYGHVMLRGAQAYSEKVASTVSGKHNVRVASNIGISTTPGLTFSRKKDNNAPFDLQRALEGPGFWTMPEIDEDEE